MREAPAGISVVGLAGTGAQRREVPVHDGYVLPNHLRVEPLRR